MKNLILIFAAAILFFSCSEEVYQPDVSYSSVAGYVFENADKYDPIADVVVTAGGITTTTSSDGKFYFPKFPDGQIVIRFEHEKFKNVDTGFTLRGNANLNLFLKRKSQDVFPLELNYRWWYDVYDSLNNQIFNEEVFVVPDTLYGYNNPRDKFLYNTGFYQSELVGKFKVVGDTVFQNEIYPILIFPLEKGKKWMDNYAHTYEVIAHEKIVVPAGKFENCWLIKDYSYVSADGVYLTYYWFVPNIGIVREHYIQNGRWGNSNHVRELKQFYFPNR